MGTVRFNKQRKAWMIDYLDAAGRRIRQVIGPGEENSRLARTVLAEREAEATLGIHRVKKSEMPRFRDYAPDWLKRHRPPKESTADNYEQILNNHLTPAFGEMRLSAITKADVEHYRNRKVDEEGLAPGTVNQTLKVLKALLSDAVADDLLPKSPAFRVRSLPDRDDEGEVRALNVEQIGRLLEAAVEPWRTMFIVGIGTGLRPSELLGLQWRDLDLDADPPMLYVRKQLATFGRRVDLKNNASRGDLDLDPGVAEVLRALPRGDDPERDFVFLSRRGGPIDRATFGLVLKKYLGLAGLPDTFTPHSLRHTHASLLFDQGVDPKTVQHRLRHASLSVTMDTYTHFIRPQRRHVGHLVHGALFGNRKATEHGEAHETRMNTGAERTPIRYAK